MYADFKITGWERVEIPEKHHDAVVRAIKAGEIKSSCEAISFIDTLPGYSNLSVNIIAETEEQMIPAENDNQATIEIVDNGTKEVLWNNETEERPTVSDSPIDTGVARRRDELMFEVSSAVMLNCDTPVVSEVEAKEGRTSLYEFAIGLADKFEKEFPVSPSDLSWEDIDAFLKKELNLQE